ncbi:MAG: hypothetical protein K0R14_625 [Burkholderiales bacterium]|jgi:hypothetical protein|nr:hypothetical protein [Burkholderiales bacterium]
MIRKVSRILAACLAFSTLASATYACIPALIVVRHAEDKESVHELTEAGKSHARMYEADLPEAIANIKDSSGNPKYCYIDHFVSSDRGSPNSFNTVRKLAEASGKYDAYNNIDKIVSSYNGVALTPGASIWKDQGFLYSLTANNTSTFMAASKEALWGDNMDSDSVLNILANKESDRNYLRNIKSPFHNEIYIFSEQDPITKRFNHVDMYVQLYRHNTFNGWANTNCVFKVQDNSYGEWVNGIKPEIRLKNLELLTHNDNFTDFKARFKCF